MSSAPSVEERIDKLERELADVKRRLDTGPETRDWISPVVGSMTKHPDFQEVVRLGSEIRRADRSDIDE